MATLIIDYKMSHNIVDLDRDRIAQTGRNKAVLIIKGKIYIILAIFTIK